MLKAFLIFLKKWVLLGILIMTFGVICYFDLYKFLTFSTFKTYHAVIQQWTHTHYLEAVLLYISIFTLLIACAIPCATILTLLAGFLFGIVGLLYAIISPTLGGVILFLAIRTALGAKIAQKTPGWLKIMERGFHKNAFHYLLMLRLFPILPCWVSNVSAGMLNVPLKTFVGATLIGITPAAFIYVMAGRSLDKLFAGSSTPTLNQILTPSVFLPLFGLAILSLFPVFYKRIKKHSR